MAIQGYTVTSSFSKMQNLNHNHFPQHSLDILWTLHAEFATFLPSLTPKKMWGFSLKTNGLHPQLFLNAHFRLLITNTQGVMNLNRAIVRLHHGAPCWIDIKVTVQCRFTSDLRFKPNHKDRPVWLEIQTDKMKSRFIKELLILIFQKFFLEGWIQNDYFLFVTKIYCSKEAPLISQERTQS